MLRDINCNNCNSNQYRIINTFKLTKEDIDIDLKEVRLVKCKNCGLIYLNPQPYFSYQDLEHIYDKNYFGKQYIRFSLDEKGFSSNENYKFRLDLIERYINKGKLLDIGCAGGGFLMYAKSRGYNVEGIDISEFAVNFARSKGLDVIKGTLEELNFTENYFDVVCASDILEHVFSPIDFLREVYRILKHNGIFYVAVPNARSFYYFFFGLVSKFNHRNYFVLPLHLYHFNKNVLTGMLKRIGFQIERVVFSSSFNPNFFLNLFNFRDRIIVLARK